MRIFLCRLLFLIFLMATPVMSYGQCAMCRRVAETGHENKRSAGGGLNTGILYLMAVPYLLGGVGALIWYKTRKK